MDSTTIVLAVDSTQVNSASAALQRMAAEGFKAETVTAKLANTATLQGKALNVGIVKNAAAAADSIKGLTGATTALAGAQDFSKTTSSLAAAGAQARAAAAEVRAFSSAVASVGTSSGVSFSAPKSSTVQQIAQAPIAVAARNILGSGGQFAARGPLQGDAAASVRDLSTAAHELDTKEISAVNTALAATSAKAVDATKSVSALDAALTARKPTNAGQDTFGAAKAQQAAAPSASAALASAAGKQTSQAAFPAVSAETSASIDRYIKQLQTEQAVLGKTVREAELYKLALRGATAEQLKAADASLKLTEAYHRGEAIGNKIKLGLLAAGVAAAGAAVGLYKSVKGAIDAADHLNDLSKKTGIAVETLGGLGFAASQSGGDLETVAKAAGNLGKSIAQAARGNKEYVGAFSAMGISVKDAGGKVKQVDTVLAEVADKFAGYADGPNKTALAYKLMKESGAGLIGMLNDGGQSLTENIDYYKRYAGVTQEVATKSDEFNDTLGKLNLIGGAFSRTLASELLSPLQSVAGAILTAKENSDAFEKTAQRVAHVLVLLAKSAVIGGFGVLDLVDRVEAGQNKLGALLKFDFAGARKIQDELDRTKKSSNEARAALLTALDAPKKAADPSGSDKKKPKEGEKPEAPSIPKVGGAGRANNEASQVLREQLADDLSAIKAAFDAEKAAITFQQKFVQGVYQAGGISLKDFYDNKRETIAAGVTAELAELDKEIARLEQYKNAIKDPSEKVKTQKQINQVGAQKEKLSTAAARDIVTANQEETASFKALDDQVANYRANLLQLQGDELGAARIRADIAKDNASILSKQSGGKISEADVQQQSALAEAANQFAEVQRRAGELAQNTARAEEAANLASEISGRSLLETENAVYAVREKALNQLGALAAKAAELAKVSTDPKIKQTAADLALAYANAADKLDPALQRLRSMQKDIASSITGTIDSGVAGFGQAYLARRREQQQDAAKPGGKAESGAVSAVKTIGTTIIAPIAGQITATINKTLVTEPLQKYLEVQIKGLTEGDGIFAKFFKDSLGIKDPKLDANNAILAQAAAANASASAMDVLAAAANSAAGALGGGNSKPLTVEAGAQQAAPALGDFTRADRALGDGSASADSATSQAAADARAAVDGFGATTTSAAKDVAKLAQAAGAGGGALGLLPTIISLFQAAVSAMSVGSAASGGSGGGLVGGIASLFSNSGGSSAAAIASNPSFANPAAADVITSFIFHKGGVVGGSGESRGAPSSIFAGAARYHTGGIAGKTPDGARAAIAAALKHGEVPAILMKNEEVLRRDDPRHRDNLGSDVFAKLMQSKGDNSASVLQGLLSRMGVKDEPAMASALKVAGARELGGPVSAGKLYRVNEKRPELLNVSGKQYLMMGSQGGKVDPNPQAGSQPAINVNINQSFAPGTDRTTANQAAAQSGHAARRALTRMS